MHIALLTPPSPLERGMGPALRLGDMAPGVLTSEPRAWDCSPGLTPKPAILTRPLRLEVLREGSEGRRAHLGRTSSSRRTAEPWAWKAGRA